MKTARYSKQHSKNFIAIQYIILVYVNLAEVSQLKFAMCQNYYFSSMDRHKIFCYVALEP